MAYIVLGAHETQWHAADWIARNAFELLIPALRAAGDHALAERCRTEIARGTQTIDLTDLLADEATSARWRQAVRSASDDARAEPLASWNEPARKPDFVAALETFETLARGGGNAFVVALAKKFS